MNTSTPLPPVAPSHTRAPASIQTPGKNLLDTVVSAGTFGTFGKAVEKAGMSDKLRGPGLFTVFAPTDAAFERLPAGRLDTLFKPENREELASIVNYHVVAGRRSAADVGQWKEVRTINGQSAPIKLADGKLSIDGAQIVTADIGSSNGVLYGIDKVNIPAPSQH